MAVTDRNLPLKVLPTNEVRKCLSATSRLFNERGADAEPVFFGPHRKPAGVILSYQRYLRLLDMLDDFSIQLEVRRRDRTDDGSRLSLDQLIREQGFESEDLTE